MCSIYPWIYEGWSWERSCMRNTGSVSSNPKRMRSKSTPRPVADSEFLLVGKMAMEQFYAVSAEQEEVEFHRT